MNRHIHLVVATILCTSLVLVGLLTLTRPSPGVAAPKPEPADDKADKAKVEAKVEPHPLDPLSADEISRAVEVIHSSGKVSKTVFFPTITLHEPSKSVVAKHKSGDAVARAAFVVLLDRPAGRTFEAVVDLKAKKLLSLEERQGVQPHVMVEEFLTAPDIVRKDKRWRKAMIDRGLKEEQLKDVALDSWAAGYVDRPDLKGQRLVRTVAYLRGDSANQFPRVIEGVIALVNLTTGEVVEVLDGDKVPIPTDPTDFYDPKQVGPQRAKLTPLQVKQPDGANFTLHGNEVRWQKWSLRHSFHPRDGLVLHAVSYEDGGKPRSILYRASLCDMVVPYADPSGAWNWRNAFDVGEYGLGMLASPLRPGFEVPETATILPVVLADDLGKPSEVKNVVAIYEQDGGMLWTHYDFLSQKAETRRARQLVLHTLYTIGNYDYSVRWLFGQDGGIEAQIELTGIMLVKGVKDKTCAVCKQKPDEEGRLRPVGPDRYGNLVAPQIIATHHQHFFNFRLDFDIEGADNSVYETELVPEDPVPGNPERNAIVMNQRVLRCEREAQRDLDSRSHRAWKVLNPNRETALGHSPAYELVPGTNAVPLAHPEATVRKRAEFMSHHLWATRYKAGELYAVGDYPNQSAGGEGLPRFAHDNEALVNADVVLWYTLGVSHAARAEEWPVMPTSRVGFRLVPHNFFNRNPALDVP